MKVWLMKTRIEWFNDIIANSIVAIDQEYIDDWYYSYTQTDRRERISKTKIRVKMVERFSQNFIEDVSLGDIIIVGTGQTHKFTVSAVARIIGDYKFSEDYKLRHYRDVEFLDLERQIPFDAWSQVNRIDQLKDENLDQFATLFSKLMFQLFSKLLKLFKQEGEYLMKTEIMDELKGKIEEIISGINSGYIFDSHTIISILVEKYSRVYYNYVSEFNSSESNLVIAIHGHIGQLINNYDGII